MSPEEDLRVLIVDDEPLARDFLRRVVEGVPDVRVVGECSEGAAAVHAIEDDPPDVVFLDIRMPEVDGFDVIERVGAARMPEVVFVTAHEQHTLRAFEVHALHYVVKPCEPERIRAALEHARHRVRSGRPGRVADSLDGLLRTLRAREGGSAGAAPTRLTVREGERVRFIDIDNIDWIEADGGDVLVHAGDKTYPVRVSLRGLLDHLGPGRFVRIHRSAAVSLAHVAEVRPLGHGDWVAVLVNGKKLRVTRTYKDELLGLVH